MAAENQHFEIIKYSLSAGLIEHGADIHAKNDEALRDVAKKGNLNIFKYLIEHGANIHAFYNAPLRMAKMNKHTDVVNYLLNIINLEK